MQLNLSKPTRKIGRLNTPEKYIVVAMFISYAAAIVYISAMSELVFRVLVSSMVAAIFFISVLLKESALEKASCKHAWVELEVAEEPETIRSEGSICTKKIAVCLYCHSTHNDIAGVKLE